jgi:hypothetical protein
MALVEKLKQLGLSDGEVAELLGKAPRNALELSGNDLRAVRDDGTPVVVLSAPSLLTEFGVNANLLSVAADGTTVTFYVDAATGKLYAGVGSVILDNNGLSVNSDSLGSTQTKIKLLDTNGLYIGSLFGLDPGAGGKQMTLICQPAENATSSLSLLSTSPNGKTSTVNITASQTGGGNSGLTATDTGMSLFGKVGFFSAGELTIATGVITVTGSRHTVDTEGDAATDNLDTINGGADGDILILSSAASARNVVLKDGSGNLNLAGDCTLDTVTDRIMLINYNGTSWNELNRSINA